MLTLWRGHSVLVRESADAMALHADLRAAYTQLMSRVAEAGTAWITQQRATGAAPTGCAAETIATALVGMTERSLYAAVAGHDPDTSDADRVAAIVEIWVRSVFLADDPRTEN